MLTSRAPASQPPPSNVTTLGARRYLAIALAVSLSLSLSFVLFFQVRKAEKERIGNLAEGQAHMHATSLQRALDRYVGVLESIGGLFAASQKVEREEFARFVSQPLSQESGIRALQWVPYVKDSELESFEAMARMEGMQDFAIFHDGHKEETASDWWRRDHFPIYYAEPTPKQRDLLGFDLGSIPGYLEIFERACDSGEMLATPLMQLPLLPEEEPGFLILRPIYKNRATTAPDISRREELAGIAMGVFDVPAMLQSAFSDLPVGDIDLYLYDCAAYGDNRLLCRFQRGYAAPVGGGDHRNTPPAHAEYECRAEVQLPGRTWLLVCYPTEKFLAGHASWPTWWIVAAGSLLTFLLGVYLISTRVQSTRTEDLARGLMKANSDLESEIASRKKMERELRMARDELDRRVQDRTEELSRANDILQLEINERRRAERALRESEERFRTISSSAKDAIIMMDHRGRVSFWNEAASDIFGWSGEEALGRDVHDLLVPARYKPRYTKGVEHFLRSGGGQVVGRMIELTALRRDGTEVPIEISVAAVQVDGRWNAIGIVRDITVRKSAEENLRSTEGLYRLIFDAVKDGIAVISRDGILLEANAEMCSTYGYSREEIIGMNVSGIVEPESLDRIWGEVEALKEGESITVRSVGLHKDDTPITSEMRISAVTYQGAPAVVGVLRRAADHRCIEAEVFDREGFLERVGGDEDLARCTMESFLEETPHQVDAMRSAREAQEVVELRRQAHMMVGAAGTVGAMSVHRIAVELEGDADRGDLTRAADLVDEIEHELGKLKEVLAGSGASLGIGPRLSINVAEGVK